MVGESSFAEVARIPRRVGTVVARGGAAALAVDQDNRVVAVNAAAESLLECDLDTALGRPLHHVLRARDVFGNRLCADACPLHAMARSAEEIRAFELELEVPEAEPRRVTVSVIVFLGPQEGEHHLVLFLRPRLRRRRADLAIERLLADEEGLHPPAPSAAGGHGTLDGDTLTRRQVEVLRRVAAGDGCREIAEALRLSVHTVRNHVQNILRRLGVHNKTEAVSVAIRRRLI